MKSGTDRLVNSTEDVIKNLLYEIKADIDGLRLEIHSVQLGLGALHQRVEQLLAPHQPLIHKEDENPFSKKHSNLPGGPNDPYTYM